MITHGKSTIRSTEGNGGLPEKRYRTADKLKIHDNRLSEENLVSGKSRVGVSHVTRIAFNLTSMTNNIFHNSTIIRLIGTS